MIPANEKASPGRQEAFLLICKRSREKHKKYFYQASAC